CSVKRAILVLCVSAVVACASASARTTTIWVPPAHTTWQWQLQGKVDQTVAADLFDIDLFDARPGQVNAGVIASLHAKGKHVLCYLDTGAWESYRPDASQFPASVIGNSTGWTNEY